MTVKVGTCCSTFLSHEVFDGCGYVSHIDCDVILLINRLFFFQSNMLFIGWQVFRSNICQRGTLTKKKPHTRPSVLCIFYRLISWLFNIYVLGFFFFFVENTLFYKTSLLVSHIEQPVFCPAANPQWFLRSICKTVRTLWNLWTVNYWLVGFLYLNKIHLVLLHL